MVQPEVGTTLGEAVTPMAQTGVVQTAEDAIGSALWKVRFNALRNAHYHKARQRRLEAFDRAANFLVVILGTTAAADLGTGIGAWIGAGEAKVGAAAIGFLVAVIGAAQLVFSWSNRANLHDQLQRRFYEILAQLEVMPSPTAEAVRKFEAELIRIYADEPPTMRALDAIAYNETIDALGSPNGNDDRLVIGPLQSLFSHVRNYAHAHFPTIREQRESRTRGQGGALPAPGQ